MPPLTWTASKPLARVNAGTPGADTELPAFTATYAVNAGRAARSALRPALTRSAAPRAAGLAGEHPERGQRSTPVNAAVDVDREQAARARQRRDPRRRHRATGVHGDIRRQRG